MKTVTPVLLLLLLMLLAVPSFGSGAPDQDPHQQQVHWILDNEAGNHEMLLERFYLPTSLSALIWTDFVASHDEIRFESRAGYRVLSKKKQRTETLGPYTLYAFTLRIELLSPPDPPAGSPRTYTVGYRYDTDQTGRVAAQPLQQALIQAIRQSGKQAGSARVTELRYLSAGRFQATVQVL